MTKTNKLFEIICFSVPKMMDSIKDTSRIDKLIVPLQEVHYKSWIPDSVLSLLVERCNCPFIRQKICSLLLKTNFVISRKFPSRA